MAINFPDSPTNGETHAAGSFTWQYDGEKWVIVADITKQDLLNLQISLAMEAD